MDTVTRMAAAGLNRQEMRFQIIANNLSNIQTAGFKKDVPVFGQVLAGAAASFQDVPLTDFQQGHLRRTGNELDLAIEGEGFFKIRTPRGIRYTRNGSFSLNREGVLVRADGLPVLGRQGEIVLRGKSIEVDESGRVLSGGKMAGQITPVTFAELGQLQKEGGALFSLAQDAEEIEIPQSRIRQGYLEAAGVNPLEEMVLLVDALRSFESCQRVVQSQDELDGKAVNELGKV